MLADALAQLKAVAGECADTPTWPLSDDALVDCLDTIHEIAQTITAAESHLIREIDGRGLPVAQHASSTAVWLREHPRISIHAAKRMLDLASALDQRPALNAALVAGVVNAALDPLCAPRHEHDEPRTPAQRRADALVEVCALSLRTEHLPTTAGSGRIWR